MLQYIITILIIAVAAGISLYRFVKFLKNPFSKCDGCSKSCNGCSIEELKKEIHSEKKFIRKAGNHI